MQFFHKCQFAKLFSTIFLLTFCFSASIFAESAIASDTSLRQETTRNILNDDVEGEDLQIRRVAVETLGTAAGTVVVMDAQTGRILTIVNQDWGIRQAFKPCSTIKLVTAVAGYNERLIRADGNLEKGVYRLGLDDALAFSNNAYFQKVGANLGSGKMIDYARRLGLGEQTGINAEGETSGRLPYGNENLRIYSHADDYRTSPLQLAVMVSALTNGGKLLVPKIPRSRIEKTKFQGFWKREIGVNSSVYERVIPGMIGAVERGTAKSMEKANMSIAGKTGSCIADKTWIGLFASVAPIENPRFAVVVITKGQYARGKHSAAVAGKIYQALEPYFNRKFNGTVARLNVRSTPKINLKTSAKVNDSEKPENNTKNEILLAETKPDAPTENTNKSNNNNNIPITKELFPTIVINGKAEITRPRVVQNK